MENAQLSRRGVHWTINTTGLLFILGITDIIIQTLAFCMLVFTLRTAFLQLRRNQSRFWVASFTGLVCLTPVPLFEITFNLSQFSSESLWVFPPWATLIGDILLRVASVILVICRFHRVYIISQLPPTRSKLLFTTASFLIGIAMAVNLWSNFIVRVAQINDHYDSASNLPTPLDEIPLNQDDRTISFATFILVNGAVVATDVIFFTIVIRSATKLKDIAHKSKSASLEEARKQRQIILRLLLPYLPSLAVTLLYLAVLLVTIIAPSIPKMTFASIALNRFAPAVEAFIFYNFTVGQTRRVMNELSSKDSSRDTDMPNAEQQRSLTAKRRVTMREKVQQLSKNLGRGSRPAQNASSGQIAVMTPSP
ncbi:hypothetical protein RI367_005228 [Sorochytrium milnesiophthora]